MPPRLPARLFWSTAVLTVRFELQLTRMPPPTSVVAVSEVPATPFWMVMPAIDRLVAVVGPRSNTRSVSPPSMMTVPRSNCGWSALR